MHISREELNRLITVKGPATALRELRERKGLAERGSKWTQGDLEKELSRRGYNFTRAYISLVETDTTPPI